MSSTSRSADQEAWAEVEEWFEEEAEDPSISQPDATLDPAVKYARSQLRVVRETKDYQLDYLRHALEPERKKINTSPAYQRRLRWTTKKRSLLIESFLLNIPVPPIFLFEHDYNEYEVIDGRQRLESIKEFLNNNFALAGLEYWSELERKRFNDLPAVLQKGLLRRSLSAVVLLAETREAEEDDLDVRRVLFDRLNTGGIRLNPQELRNALYPGPLNALLISLARLPVFTSTWNIPSYNPGEEVEPSEALLKNALYSSLADAELVLRFFALRDAIQHNRAGSLRRILDRFMEENSNVDQSVLNLLRHEFEDLLCRLALVFEGKPFRLPRSNRISRPLYDALMIALSLNPMIDLQSNKVAVQQALAAALEDNAKYDILVGRGNTIESVRERVQLADKILHSGI